MTKTFAPSAVATFASTAAARRETRVLYGKTLDDAAIARCRAAGARAPEGPMPRQDDPVRAVAGLDEGSHVLALTAHPLTLSRLLAEVVAMGGDFERTGRTTATFCGGIASCSADDVRELLRRVADEAAVDVVIV